MTEDPSATELSRAVNRIKVLGRGARIEFVAGPRVDDTDGVEIEAVYAGRVDSVDRSGIWIELVSGPDIVPGVAICWPDASFVYRKIRVTGPPPKTRPISEEQEPETPKRATKAKPKRDRNEEVPGSQVVLTEQQFQRLLRRHESESDSSADNSDSDEERYDRIAGARNPMRSVVKGLRVPKNTEPHNLVWYPHLWQSGQAWEVAVRQKFAEFSCCFRLARTKADLDLDISILRELIDRRLQQPPNMKAEHRTTFTLTARIASTLLHTTPMANSGSAESFMTAFSRAFEEGRVDFEKMIASKLSLAVASTVTTTQPTVETQPPPTRPQSNMKAESADHWRQTAEELHRQLLLSRGRNTHEQQNRFFPRPPPRYKRRK